MNINGKSSEEQAPLIQLPVTRAMWQWCIGVGLFLWLVAVILWLEGSIDQKALFFFNDARIEEKNFLVVLSQWLSSNGMAAISSIYVLYLMLSFKLKRLDAPPAINFYIISSMALTGIAGDLLKQALLRPRPIAMFPDVLTVLSQGGSPAMPSGHATKAMALAIPFVILVSNRTLANKVVKILVSLIALGVVISRVILGAHYVSDVVAGMGMAIMGLPFTMLFANMVLKQVDEKRLARLRIVWGVLLVALTVIFMII